MKVRIILVGFALIAGFAVVSTPSYADNAGDKLIRGAGNILTSWVEVPHQVSVEIKESNSIMGITVGLARGLGMMVARTFIGVYEVATFPVPIPEFYEPMIEPANILFK
jgi:putative exosortase-associated protein (TIGR04073 family)